MDPVSEADAELGWTPWPADEPLPDPTTSMTLGDAMRLYEPDSWFDCACVGGAYCCFRQIIQRNRLHRAAHIVAKLMDDACSISKEE